MEAFIKSLNKAFYLCFWLTLIMYLFPILKLVLKKRLVQLFSNTLNVKWFEKRNIKKFWPLLLAELTKEINSTKISFSLTFKLVFVFRICFLNRGFIISMMIKLFSVKIYTSFRLFAVHDSITQITNIYNSKRQKTWNWAWN